MASSMDKILALADKGIPIQGYSAYRGVPFFLESYEHFAGRKMNSKGHKGFFTGKRSGGMSKRDAKKAGKKAFEEMEGKGLISEERRKEFLDMYTEKAMRSQVLPTVEDEGPEVEKFVVKGYFLLSKQMPAPDTNKSRLIKAMNDEPKGTLILPGVKSSVFPGAITFTNSNKEGGIEYFTVTFYVDTASGISAKPAFIVPNTARAVKEEAEKTFKAVQVNACKSLMEDTSEGWSSALKKLGITLYEPALPDDTPPDEIKKTIIKTDLPEPKEEDILPKVLAEQVEEEVKKSFLDKIKALASTVKSKMDQLDVFIQMGKAFADELVEIINLPGVLISKAMGMIAQVVRIAQSPFAAFNALMSFIDGLGQSFKDLFPLNFLGIGSGVSGGTVTPPDPSTASPDEIEEFWTMNSLYSSFLSGTLTNAMLLASTIDYASIIEAMDTVSTTVILPPEQQENLRELFAASMTDLTQRAANLPLAEEIELNGSLPLLVVSYGKYGDASRFQDISDRNSTKNNLLPSSTLTLLSS